MTRYEDLTPRQRRRVDLILNTVTLILFAVLVIGVFLAAQTDLRP